MKTLRCELTRIWVPTTCSASAGLEGNSSREQSPASPSLSITSTPLPFSSDLTLFCLLLEALTPHTAMSSAQRKRQQQLPVHFYMTHKRRLLFAQEHTHTYTWARGWFAFEISRTNFLLRDKLCNLALLHVCVCFNTQYDISELLCPFWTKEEMKLSKKTHTSASS